MLDLHAADEEAGEFVGVVPHDAPPAHRYQYRQKAGTGNWGNPNWANITGSSTSTTSHTLSNLLNGTTYTIEIRAARGTTLGVAGQVIGTPRTPPLRPAGFTATAGDKETMLGWTDPGDTSISKYQ